MWEMITINSISLNESFRLNPLSKTTVFEVVFRGTYQNVYLMIPIKSLFCSRTSGCSNLQTASRINQNYQITDYFLKSNWDFEGRGVLVRSRINYVEVPVVSYGSRPLRLVYIKWFDLYGTIDIQYFTELWIPYSVISIVWYSEMDLSQGQVYLRWNLKEIELHRL